MARGHSKTQKKYHKRAITLLFQKINIREKYIICTLTIIITFTIYYYLWQPLKYINRFWSIRWVGAASTQAPKKFTVKFPLCPVNFFAKIFRFLPPLFFSVIALQIYWEILKKYRKKGITLRKITFFEILLF